MRIFLWSVTFVFMFQAAFAWTGDLSKFSFNADTISLNAPAETSDAYISDTSSVVYTAVWQCNFKFDFASSSSNYIKWYLFSDSASLKGELHGYFIRIGYTDKNISLCRQSGTSISVLAQGNEKRVQENAPIYIKVSRDEFGVWSVYSNIETDADTLLEFTVTDNTFERAKFSGFYLKYSSTRSKGYSMWGLSCKGEPYKEFPKPKYREIVINEILSYPYTEGYDFVEIFNNSDSTFNLADITLGNGKTEVTLPSKKFYSGEYKVFTQDSASLEEFYNCTDNAIIELKIPSYVKDSGSVVLRCGTVLVDSVYYNAKTMHSPMLSDVQGVSFERVNPNIDVWASAAENVGFATPGYENSQYKPIKPIVKTDKTIWVEPATFTPNGDGRDDLAMIYYKLDESAVANIAVYNTDGVLVKVLCNRMFLSPSGIITWNGFSDRNMLMPFGIYVVIFEVFNNSKVIMKKKVPFVLGR